MKLKTCSLYRMTHLKGSNSTFITVMAYVSKIRVVGRGGMFL